MRRDALPGRGGGRRSKCLVAGRGELGEEFGAGAGAGDGFIIV